MSSSPDDVSPDHLADDWARLRPSYEKLIGDESRDSWYLRSKGLQRNVIELVGDCSDTRLLDVGCGTGWLLDAIRPREGYECDSVEPASPRAGRLFSREDLRALGYPSAHFDIVVASLVLMWVEEVEQACSELARVLVAGGRAVIALVHPFSYRTGSVADNGEFVVRRRYSTPFVLEDLYIANEVGPLRYYHRPLADYVNAAARAGLVMDELREWSIDLEDYRRHVAADAKHPARTDRVPMYAFFRMHKAQ